MGEREPRRTPIFFMSVIIFMLIMSLAALLLAIEAYLVQGKLEIINIILSASALFLATYMFIQIRRRSISLGFETLKVSTIIQCLKCDYRNVREFEKGDYILRDAGSCPKCGGTLIIHSIFRESKEKD
ncbi:hypothetical protein KEJ34_06625 [Candidatus Bathyarchaeota archaeon]|nr:hypothetical protein [Candidatus Bathyarchaeota archaeon]